MLFGRERAGVLPKFPSPHIVILPPGTFGDREADARKTARNRPTFGNQYLSAYLGHQLGLARGRKGLEKWSDGFQGCRCHRLAVHRDLELKVVGRHSNRLL